jgi:ABC-type amino acid transport substrate-binding protein
MSRALRLLVLAALLLGSTQAVRGQQSHVAAIKARGKLVAIAFPQQDNPFISVNLAAGPMQRVGGAQSFVGLDVEIMKALADSLGVQLEIRTVSQPTYAELIPDLLRGDGDIVVSGLNITPDRLKLVDFSLPYYQPVRMVITVASSPMKSIADFANKHTAIVAGSSQMKYIEDLHVPGLQVTPTDFTRDAILAVRDGSVDFTVADTPNAARFLREFATLKAAFELPGAPGCGYALPKGSDLMPVLDALLARLSKDGTLKRTLDKYLK